jgi:hypothetical protein
MFSLPLFGIKRLTKSPQSLESTRKTTKPGSNESGFIVSIVVDDVISVGCVES